MKTPRNSRAFALLLVLITIVLSTAMAVFFLTSAGRERRGVSLYATSSEVRHLASTSVSRVMGQINAATKEGTAAAPVSWASQPGMIRTFAGGGDARNIYKLYSWDTALSVPGAGFIPTAAAQVPPAGWQNLKAQFVDLNQPISGVYPILDPGAVGLVEGFTIDSGNPAVAGSGSAAPMPVRWLYVLEDGQMVAAGAGSATTASVAGSSINNPIIGRVAFWTDDETSKVNINTASEGAYWDWPKAATYDEIQFAANPPMGGEFNRTPGHPAMTSLSAVFPELDPGDRWANVGTYRTKISNILNITPRVPYSDTSSRGGTFPIETASFNYGPTGSLPPVPSASLALKTERLFVSPEEILFQHPLRNLQPNVSVEMLRQRSFFLTSSSKAPETTLFETPRISLWPVTWSHPTSHAALPSRQMAAVTSPNPDTTRLENNTWMRAEERLLAFTSTLNRQRSDGGDKYYFQRQNSESPTHDYTEIRRNRELLSYLQAQTAKTLPGFGGTFIGKYPAATRDFILANAFNVTRSLVNQYTLQSDGRMLYSYTPVSFSRFRRPNNTVTAQSYVEAGAFSSIPLRLNLGSGPVTTLNEFPKLREAALVFYATDRVLPTPKPAATNLNNPYEWDNLINTAGAPGYPAGARTNKMRVVMLLDFFPLAGSTGESQPIFWVKLTVGNMSVSGQNLGFNNAVAKLDYRSKSQGGNVPQYLLPFYRKDTNGVPTGVKTVTNGDVSDTNYGLISNEITVSPSDISFPFNGGVVTVEIYGIKDGNPATNPTTDANLLVASYNVDFSSWNSGALAIPIAPRWNFYDKMTGKFSGSGNKLPECPNPNFQDFDPTNFPNTRWVATEIAPGYQTANASSDPATGGSGATVAFNGMFRVPQGVGPDGSNIPPPPSNPALGENSFPYGRTVAYAFRDNIGERIMTDYANRIRFFPIRISPPSTFWNAENSGLRLNLTVGNAPSNMFNPGGFPAITAYDTAISVIPDPVGPGRGDPRLADRFEFQRVDTVLGPSVTLRSVVPPSTNPRLNTQKHTMGASERAYAATGYVTPGLFSTLGSTIAPTGMAQVGARTISGKLGFGNDAGDSEAMGVNSLRPIGTIGGSSSVGDWSSQPGYYADGGTIPRPDQDFQSLTTVGAGSGVTYLTPYFRVPDINTGTAGASTAESGGFFSANRQVPSPISILGALPTDKNVGWQTLAFSPNPSIGSSHPGLVGLRDHVLLDLFWMPVAEPYPISEEFSTAGKINLNYKIAPFNYINRKTGLNALMKSTWLTVLHNSLARDYKSHDYVKGLPNAKTRYKINIADTLNRFDTDVFDTGNIFRSASQICEMWLVPEGRTAGNVEAFWNDKLLTSDTAREAPYDHLYSRVTTKSNTFTVHWRAQILKKVPGTAVAVWDESKDRVMSELRGSTLIERFIDPNATDIPDYATVANAEPLTNFYKWRVVSENYFQP